METAMILMRRHIAATAILLAALFSPTPARAAAQVQQDSQDWQATHENYRYRVALIADTPVIDGDLSDAAWASAAVMDQFTQQEPLEGQPTTERSQVRVLRDRDNIYIAVMNEDSDPDGVVRNVLRFRDDSVWQKDDVVRFVIDTFHDHRRGYVFSINPRGAKQDSQVDNQTWNSDWDEVWNVKTRLLSNGWTIEMAIPFRILRFPTGGTDDVWGFNVVRSIKRKNESVSWAPIPAGQSLIRNEFLGHLEGMSGIEPRRNMQWIPYGLFISSRTTERDAVTKGEFGGDFKYSLTSALSLDLTYNTNFAQVEADDAQVNLTRFSLRFPEKREFFLENAQIFNFGVESIAELFFSRRIGLANRAPVPILGGARLTGRVRAFDVGVLTTQTRESAGVAAANFSTGRFRWNLGRRSYVGGILTSVANGANRNLTYGPDAIIWLGRNLRAESFFAAVDDQKLAARKKVFGGTLNYNTDPLELQVRGHSIDKGLNSALGFVPRDDMRRFGSFARRSFRLNKPWSRRVNFSTFFVYITNQRGELGTRDWGMTASNQFDSGDTLTIEHKLQLDTVPVDELFAINPRKNISVSPGSFRFNRNKVEYVGFDGRSIVPSGKIEFGDYFSGRGTTVELKNVWRASPHLLLEGFYQLNALRLAEGDFNAHIGRSRVTVPLTERMVTDALLQWNSLEDTFSTQVRFHMIYARESNLYVVYTNGRRPSESPLDPRSRVADQALQVKLTYRLYQ